MPRKQRRPQPQGAHVRLVGDDARVQREALNVVQLEHQCRHKESLLFVLVVAQPFHVEAHVKAPGESLQRQNDALCLAEAVRDRPVSRRREGRVELRRK